jgi:hypothetical protein
MSTTNTFGDPAATVGTMNGFFKELYADKIKVLYPEDVHLLNMIDFSGKEKNLGNLYHQPVALGLEHGITYAGPDEDAFNLLPAVSSPMRDAQVKGNAKVMRAQIGYNALSRSGSDKASFGGASKYVVENAMRSFTKILEIELLYGQMGYGTVSAVSAATVTVTLAEWAPGIWSGSKGMPIEIRDTTGATSRGQFVISSVNLDTRVLTLDSSAAAAGVVATDVIWRRGAYNNEFAGIHKILSQSTGSLFNISVSDFELWRGNSFSASSAALSFNKLNLAVTRAIEKGHMGKLLALISLKAWANMMSDQAALRKYDGSYSKQKMENGSERLVFHSQNGEIEILPSIYVKEGYAYLLSEDNWMRVGSRDISFNIPGMPGDQILRQLENSAAYEFRMYTDQALFCSAPGRNVLLNEIVNSTT